MNPESRTKNNQCKISASSLKGGSISEPSKCETEISLAPFFDFFPFFQSTVLNRFPILDTINGKNQLFELYLMFLIHHIWQDIIYILIAYPKIAKKNLRRKLN